MMMSGRDGGFPFTATQWQELEHQALIFKYMVAGMPIPPDLLFSLKRSFDYSLSSKLLLHQPHHVGWNCFQMGFGRKIDPEPGRCRRTDGKKWRCSKEAHTDSKYCERHMHRGRNRSRKPVEITTTTTSTNANNVSSTALTPTPIPKYPSNPSSYSLSSMASSDTHHTNHSFLYPHSSTRPPSIGPYSHTDNDYRRNRYGDGMKDKVDEYVSFSERTMKSSSGSSMDDSWQLGQLTMGSSLTQHLEQSIPGYSSLQLQGFNDTSKLQQDHHCYSLGGSNVKYEMPYKTNRDDQHEPQKVMHHFFDEWPPRNKDSSWPLDSDDKSSNYTPAVSTTQLSISMPNYSHDFFGTRND